MTYEEAVEVDLAAEAAARISALANMIARAIDESSGERHIAQCLEAIEELADTLSGRLSKLETVLKGPARTSKAAEGAR